MNSAPDPETQMRFFRKWLVVVPLVMVIGALPWMFGGVHTSVQLLLVGSICAFLFVRLTLLADANNSIPASLVLLLAAIGLGVVQVLPLGEATHLLSPRSYELWSGSTNNDLQLAAPLVTGEKQAERQTGLRFITQMGRATSTKAKISLYPYSTRNDVVLLTASVAVFFLGSQILARARWRRALFLAVSVNGAAFAFFGIAQQLAWNGQIYGQVPLTQGGRPFAAFVNGNNAAGYLNLCMSAAIGFWLYAFSKGDEWSRDEQARRWATDGSADRSSWLRRSLAWWATQIGQLNAIRMVAVLILVVVLSGILCTFSRGAWLATAVSLGAVVAILASRKRVAAAAAGLVGVALLSLVLISWLEQGESVSSRWKSLESQFSNPTDARLDHWPAGLRASRDYWLIGSGLGTYRYAYRPYSHSLEDVWFLHAENQYIEALCEGGLIGLALMLAVLGSMFLACCRLLSDGSGDRRIVGVVGVYALLSQSVHAFFDFGLYLPANTALFALLCGTVAGAAATGRSRSSSRIRNGTRSYRRALQRFWARIAHRADLQAGLTAALSIGLIFGVSHLRAKSLVEDAVSRVGRSDAPLQNAPPQNAAQSKAALRLVTEQIEQLTTALAGAPYHAEAHQVLAGLWIHRYRLQALESLQPLAPEGTSRSQTWSLTAPLVLQQRVFRYQTQGRTIELENLRRSESVQTNLGNAARSLLQSMHSCAAMPRPRMTLAELAPALTATASTNAWSNSAVWLRSAEYLAGSNLPLLKECAMAQLQAGHVKDGLQTLQRAVSLHPSYFIESLQISVLYAKPAVAVEIIAADSIKLMVESSNSDYAGRHRRLKQAMLSRAQQLLKTASIDSARRHQINGSIHAAMERDREAIESFRNALKERPDMTAWRYELAVLQHKSGRLQEAWKNARICLRMEPDNERFDALFQQLNRARMQ